jgi:DNA-binding transcriptional MerR regulator
MSEDQSYTIGELAQKAEVTPRTIRYYVAEEVLPPPLGNSRAAFYTEEHLDRLQLIKILKDEFLPLQEIRSLLSGLDHQAVLELLAERRRAEPPPLPTPNSAKEYLQTLLAPTASANEASTLMRHKVESHQAKSPQGPEAYRRSLPQPRSLLKKREETGLAQRSPAAPAPAEPSPEATGGLWQRLELAPGVELHLKAEMAASPLRSKIEQLVKAARQIFNSREI